MKIIYHVSVMLVFLLCSCTTTISRKTVSADRPEVGKAVVYQVFTRLFGNTNSTNKPWGTVAENGVGKFNDFTDEALQQIKNLGVTHIWYTGVPHHAVIGDYTDAGITDDDPDVVKGRAGSPYAVKDYYNVNPDLAVDPVNRLEEFQALVARTHRHGMKVIIDIVPNHVARDYHSLRKPEGAEDFGARDDTSVEYHRNNNFYYVPGQEFLVPEPLDNYRPLGGEAHPLADGQFHEMPAKWTGNGARSPQPHFHDWYETVKINYGVRPDGSYDFPRLPADFTGRDYRAHAEFWADKDVPDSWRKFRDIAHYWLAMGVDGFRYDMAEMVPVEFWSYLNSSIKLINPKVFLLAEIYNPAEYRNYIHLGKMDYLYDKVGFYDTLKTIMQGTGSTDELIAVQQSLADIEEHMLHFLENHDEQRIASPEFAGTAEAGRPAMVVSTLISRSPALIYFGQEVGEPGEGDAGFGRASRTTIFDYWGVSNHQRWMNDGRFDGGKLTPPEKNLRRFYADLLNFSIRSGALQGDYREIHRYNREHAPNYDEQLLSFVRWSSDEHLIVVSNFSTDRSYVLDLLVPPAIIQQWQLKDGRYLLIDQLQQSGKMQYYLQVRNGEGRTPLRLNPLASLVFSLQDSAPP